MTYFLNFLTVFTLGATLGVWAFSQPAAPAAKPPEPSLFDLAQSFNFIDNKYVLVYSYDPATGIGAEIVPLMGRISDLELRVSVLESMLASKK